jgi:MinD-like ATPase involved in chromosome partitioning or flagellar assembly
MASFVTFYSYKGGAGRTLALSNIAVLLAQWNHRVLCVDWDLEAPGLHHYFRSHIESPPKTGLLDLATALAAQKSVSPKRYVTKTNVANLDLICAGTLESPPEWSVWYRRGFGEALETVRDAWSASYDFVLIDSRTGITDAGGICTVQMPDLLVLLTTASDQGFEGTFDVASRVIAARKKLAFDRAALQILPVLARFDQRVESAIAQTYLKRFAERIGPVCRGWLPESVPSIEIAKLTKIPYVPNLSFGEKLPVLDEGTADPESVGYALETIAALLARRLSDADLLVRNRDAYVAAAQGASAAERAREGDFAFDVFLVSRGASTIAKSLERAGLRVFEGALDSGEARESNLRGARSLVIVRDSALSGSEIEDAASFLKSADRATQRLVVVGEGDALPPLLRDAVVMIGEDAAIAERIASLLRTKTREGDPHHGAFGGESVRGGRALTATFEDDYRVTLRVQKTARGLPLAGMVRFHLHPMLPNAVRDVAVKDGVAEIEVSVPMAFTVGAEADAGATPLELDLATAAPKDKEKEKKK